MIKGWQAIRTHVILDGSSFTWGQTSVVIGQCGRKHCYSYSYLYVIVLGVKGPLRRHLFILKMCFIYYLFIYLMIYFQWKKVFFSLIKTMIFFFPKMPAQWTWLSTAARSSWTEWKAQCYPLQNVVLQVKENQVKISQHKCSQVFSSHHGHPLGSLSWISR